VVILNQLFSIARLKAFRVSEQVILDLIADHLGQNQLADLGGTQGQGCFIKSPGRDNASG
jgi:hypothetical protein